MSTAHLLPMQKPQSTTTNLRLLFTGLLLGLLICFILFRRVIGDNASLLIEGVSLSIIGLAYLILSSNRKSVTPDTSSTKSIQTIEENAVSNSAEAIFSDIPFGFLSIGLDGTIYSANLMTQKWFGYHKEELLKMNAYTHLFSPVGLGRFEAVASAMKETGLVINEELECRTQDGRLLHLMMNAKYIKSKGDYPATYRIVFSDLEERRKSELELLHSRQVIEQTLKSRERFLANMSHEMRTPLSGISGIIDLLLDSGLTAEQREFSTAIKLSADNLLSLIKDILDVSKIDSGKMELEKTGFQLSQTLQSMVALMRPKAEEKGIRLRMVHDNQIHDQLIGDSLRLGQILLNLISNSIKFTPKGIVELRTQLISQNSFSASIRFSIRDTGIGIPAERIESVFESYIQAEDTTTRMYGGTGLGLTIVKKLVELQGGVIEVKSKEGEGTEFSFEIPFKKGIIAEKTKNDFDNSHQQIGKRQFRKGNILLAEDDPVNQLFISRLLTRWGLQVTIASTGTECVSKTHSDHYDLIFMDIQMPEMNGYDATRSIRAAGEKAVPIIAMTAFASATERDKCIDAGMNDYLSKPFQINDLFNAILFHLPDAELLEPKDELPTSTAEVSASLEQERLTDLSYLLELAAGSTDFMKEMIDVFLQQTPPAIDTLKKYLEAGNYEELGILAHRMKPGIGFVGISRLKETMEMIENYSETKTHLDRIPTLVHKAEQLCMHALDELREERKKLD